ncbi:MAG: DUF2442 domain-containing protein [Oscillospiraceae bacterium]|jgi:hypothetical protein|nr:DUF2442 domain-containing protein [Oscillospiraceae bacterium]
MLRPKLFQVVPTDDYKVCLYYDNGEIRLYDCAWIAESGGVFNEIKDIAVFKELCTIMNGTLAFDISRVRDTSRCIDICPDTVYGDSIKSADILSA